MTRTAAVRARWRRRLRNLTGLYPVHHPGVSLGRLAVSRIYFSVFMLCMVLAVTVASASALTGHTPRSERASLLVLGLLFGVLGAVLRKAPERLALCTAVALGSVVLHQTFTGYVRMAATHDPHIQSLDMAELTGWLVATQFAVAIGCTPVSRRVLASSTFLPVATVALGLRAAHPQGPAQWPGTMALVLLASLGCSVFVGMARERQARLSASVRELRRAGQTDVLTGLTNRRGLLPLLESTLMQPVDIAGIGSARAAGAYVALLDLDHFKQVNDRLGHVTGDAVLVQMGRVLAAESMLGAVTGRWGGEEFMVIFPGRHQGMEVWQALDRLRSSMSRRAWPAGVELRFSAGVAAVMATDTVDSLMRRVDAALYAAKQGGRDRCVMAPAGAADPVSGNAADNARSTAIAAEDSR